MREEIRIHTRDEGDDATDIERSGDDASERMGPPGTTQVPENIEGAPTEDSPAREPTERVERLQEARPEEEDVERERP